MEFKDLLYILTIAKYGKVSTAASELFIAQSSLSQFLKNYEKSLGFPLFIRTNRGLFLTEEGKLFVESGKQILAKKEWLRQRFDEGLVFYRSEERGKCFIEYIPAENAWVPIEAAGYLYINCLWIAGAMKGHGYSTDLLNECIREARAQEKNGVCILCAEGRKREFLADPKYLAYKDFRTADISDCGISLMYLPLVPNAEPPKFRDCARHPKADGDGFVLYYTDQCPFTCYWVPRVQETAKEHGIPFKAIHITDRDSAQNVPAPVTTYALFRDGQFLTQSIQSDKKFRALAGVRD